jgi:6-phosphogluconate dehydrogenase (decarboxylating)
MSIAMVGLGKMGLNMTRRLLQGGNEIVFGGHAVKATSPGKKKGKRDG